MPRKAIKSAEQNADSEQIDAVPAEPVEEETPVVKPVNKRGRKIKYESEDDRRAARREQNRQYRERKKQELINLRRAASASAAQE